MMETRHRWLTGINRTCEEFFTRVFHACDTNCSGKLKITCWNVCGFHQVLVLSIVREREMAYLWCSVDLSPHTWWLQPNLRVRWLFRYWLCLYNFFVCFLHVLPMFWIILLSLSTNYKLQELITCHRCCHRRNTS